MTYTANSGCTYLISHLVLNLFDLNTFFFLALILFKSSLTVVLPYLCFFLKKFSRQFGGT